MKPGRLTCTFCKKNQDQVKKLIAGPSVHICDECVDLCVEILEEEGLLNKASKQDMKMKLINKPKQEAVPKARREVLVSTPRQIYEKLCEYIVGQDFTKKTLSVEVYKHYKRIQNPSLYNTNLVKENILLIGPTGTGKTLFAKTLAKILDVPFAIADATSLTDAGYVGEDVEMVLYRLIQAADGDIERAQGGIVYIDEIDKISRKTAYGTTENRDISGESVQQGLLTMFAGGTVNIDPSGKRKNPEANFLEIDTTNVLFICGGAFQGLEKIVASRFATRKEVAKITQELEEEDSVDMDNDYINSEEMIVDYDYYRAYLDRLREAVTPTDLIAFGFVPEFAGRFTSVATLHSLDENDLIRILTEVNNGFLKQYENFFQAEGIKLTFEDEAIKAIARTALAEGSGARGLKNVLDKCLLETLFEIPGRNNIKQCIITREAIENHQQPLLLNETGESIAISKKSILVSYGRKDAYWGETLKTRLYSVLRRETIDVWFDDTVKSRQDWQREIEASAKSVRLAILLITPNVESLLRDELSYFLEVAKANDVRVLWLYVSLCSFTERLRECQSLHEANQPLDELTQLGQRTAWLQVCQKVKSAII